MADGIYGATVPKEQDAPAGISEQTLSSVLERANDRLEKTVYRLEALLGTAEVTAADKATPERSIRQVAYEVMGRADTVDALVSRIGDTLGARL